MLFITFVHRHDGSENFKDDFVLTVDDTLHFVNWTIKVDVRPLNDEVPKVVRNTKLDDVLSGGWKLVTEAVLKSVDEDMIIGNALIYYILNLPIYGVIQIRSNQLSDDWKEVRQFNQSDISSSLIR